MLTQPSRSRTVLENSEVLLSFNFLPLNEGRTSVIVFGPSCFAPSTVNLDTVTLS